MVDARDPSLHLGFFLLLSSSLSVCLSLYLSLCLSVCLFSLSSSPFLSLSALGPLEPQGKRENLLGKLGYVLTLISALSFLFLQDTQLVL